jgi:hypothetical protein
VTMEPPIANMEILSMGRMAVPIVDTATQLTTIEATLGRSMEIRHTALTVARTQGTEIRHTALTGQAVQDMGIRVTAIRRYNCLIFGFTEQGCCSTGFTQSQTIR